MTRILRCGPLGVLMLGMACGTERPTAHSEIMQHSDFENAVYRRVQ